MAKPFSIKSSTFSARKGKNKIRVLGLRRFVLALLFFMVASLVGPLPASATRLPDNLRKTIAEKFPQVTVRLDGVLQTKKGTLFVPLIPKASQASDKPVALSGVYPAKHPLILAFDNGWFFVKLSNLSGKLVLTLPEDLSPAVRDALKANHLPPDMIVPQNMAVVPSMKCVIGELDIDVASEQAASSEDDGDSFAESPADVSSGDGKIFVTSPATGKILILDKDFKKVAELQTDGTPGGMTIANGRLFIADQTKNRVLIVNPVANKFDGQIDLPPGSSPRGVTAMRTGRFLYVTESAKNTVTLIELASKKVLVRTLVRPGPGRIEITPNGYLLLALNTQSSELTFISTLNQKNLGAINVGQMPSDIVIKKNNRTAYVSNRMSNTISVVDIGQRKVVDTMSTPDGPTGLALSADETLLYAANAKDNSISIFDLKTHQKLEDIRLPLEVEFPGAIVLLPDGKSLLVTSAATDTAAVLNTETKKFEQEPVLDFTSVNAIFVPL